MRFNVQRMINQLKEMFVNDQDEYQTPSYEKQEQVKQPVFKKNTRSLPLKKEENAKLIHQYPKSGPFRFPVVPDNEPIGQHVHNAEPKPNPENVKERSFENKESPRPKTLDSRKPNKPEEKSASAADLVSHQKLDEKINKTKFGGKGFAVRQIPSPVFGFGEREEETLQQYQEDVLNEFLHLEGLVTKPSITGNLSEADSTIEENPIADSPLEPEMSTEDNQSLSEEEAPKVRFESKDDDEKEPVLHESNEFSKEKEVSATLELTEPVRNEIELDDEQVNLEAHDSSTSEHEFIEENSQNYPKTIEEVEMSVKSLPAQDEVEVVTERVQESRESTDAQNRTVQQKNKKKTASSGVPFNVLMFQRDRVKQERREKMNRGKGALPELHLLEVPPSRREEDDQELTEQSQLLNQTLEYFNVRAKVVNVTRGPSVTRFEVQPEPGVKVSKITNLQDDIKLSLAAKDIRIEAPIPGKNTIGIEVPNRKSSPVFLRDILKSKSYIQSESPLMAALGVDIGGQPIVTDLQKMPHGLIAGATGSGKSVCVNAILLSLLYKASPKNVRFLLIDPKMVELAPYNGIPHLAAPVITDAKEATQALKWAVEEMERRYERFAETGSRDLNRYNQKMKEQGKEDQTFPYLVVVVDELADLMMVSPQDVEDAICRIAQKARACGIHLLVATQRPSVDVITGLIKANIPTRVAFSVSAQTDSRTILDASGAERLLGRGDMLFLGNGESKPVRLQGAFVSDDEIERVTEHVKRNGPPSFLFEKEELKSQDTGGEEDPMFEEVCRFVIEQQAASSSLLQRRFRMGFNRAARLIDIMEERGIISPSKGSKPRDVYLTNEELEEIIVGKG
ncbi:DNA translocase FtsK [Alteribacter populi]|uniref:DNA translocase FtsK n=1 Tax=Alteribacter populi TaxID=2011011 RepID=UPI001FDEB1CC|nr:DNA translocase FtsK [Alteribacter populi]